MSQIIILDGASSAGKSTLARELQRVLDEPYWHVSQDYFWGMLPPEGTTQRRSMSAEHCLTGFHGAIAALAQTGHNVIVDTGLLEKAWLDEMVRVLAGYPVLFVAVHCNVAELERRERARGDRPVGQTVAQLPFLYRHGLYDLRVDTDIDTIAACAASIREALRALVVPSAFERMRKAS